MFIYTRRRSLIRYLSVNLLSTFFCQISLQMDVTDKVSIQKAKEYIEEKEGRVHILVNKLVGRVSYFRSLINMLSNNAFLAVLVK